MHVSITIGIGFLLTSVLLGCTAQENTSTPAGTHPSALHSPNNDSSDQQPRKTAARQVIDGITGKTAVETGQKAKERIKAISEERAREMDSVISE